MTVNQWTRVTNGGIARTNQFGANMVAIGQFVYTSSASLTTSDQIGSSTLGENSTAYQSTYAPALIMPAGSTLIFADLDTNQVDTSGSGAFNVGFTGHLAAIISAASVASATFNHSGINVPPVTTSGLITQGRGLYFAADTPIFITPSTNVTTVNASGGTIDLILNYTMSAFDGV